MEWKHPASTFSDSKDAVSPYFFSGFSDSKGVISPKFFFKALSKVEWILNKKYQMSISKNCCNYAMKPLFSEGGRPRPPLVSRKKL